MCLLNVFVNTISDGKLFQLLISLKKHTTKCAERLV